MSISNLLFNRVVVLTVRFEDEAVFRVQLRQIVRQRKEYRVQRYIETVQVEKYFQQLPGDPVIVVVTGYGVAGKVVDAASSVALRVMQGDEFLWHREEAEKAGMIRLAFVRKQQLGILQVLEGKRIPVMMVGICPPDGSNEESEERFALNCAERFYKEGNYFQAVLHGELVGNRWVETAIRKWKIALLVILLMILAGNYGVYSVLKGKNVELQALLRFREQQDEGREEAASRAVQLFKRVDGTGRNDYSYLLDHIAGLVPPGIRLTFMGVTPPDKPLEDGKPLQTRENLIRIEGETDDSREVTVFSERLAEESFARQVVLIALEQFRESNKLGFKMEIRL